MDPSGLEPTWWQKIVNWAFGPSNSTPASGRSTCPVPACGPDGYRDPTPAEGAGILAAAKSYDGTPYKWGGSNGNGLDRSGLVMCAIRGSVSPNFPIDPRLNTGGLSKNPGFRHLNTGEPLYPGDILLFPGHMGLYDPDPSGWDTYSARGDKNRSTPGVTRGKQKMFGTVQGIFRVKIPCPK